jgi:hypothetical protein
MKAKIKCFRCGWCGQPCDRNGEPYNPAQIELLSPHVGWDKVSKVNGECCPGGDETNRWVTVTHDMAIDAGEPEMEGMLIKW